MNLAELMLFLVGASAAVALVWLVYIAYTIPCLLVTC